MMPSKAFSGRVIFDHLPKTAGQAINAWLIEELGSGSVTPNLIGAHQDLIRQYGGIYSIISAHIQFDIQEALDPRYQYITVFREPVERVVSWLYFVINNHDDTQLPETRAEAIQVLQSNGRDIPSPILNHISNGYVEHFCRINGTGLESDSEKVANAFLIIQQYDAVGLFHEIPQFLADVSQLISIPMQKEIARVNVTNKRPEVKNLSHELRQKIIEINQLDIELFSKILEWKKSIKKTATQNIYLTQKSWLKYELPKNKIRDFISDEITINAVQLRNDKVVQHGQLIAFDVDFFIAKDINELEMGIHIFDADKKWAFGTNSSLLRLPAQRLQRGAYRVSHHLIADLPAGKYTAGFAFAELTAAGPRELAWHDVLCEFEVHYNTSQPFAGYAYLPAQMSVSPLYTPKNHLFKSHDPRLQHQVGVRSDAYLSSNGEAGFLMYGPYLALPAGRYQLRIHCECQNFIAAGARLDVVMASGAIELMACDQIDLDSAGCIVMPPITLDQPCNDLEVRIWVNEQTQLQIIQLEITPNYF